MYMNFLTSVDLGDDRITDAFVAAPSNNASRTLPAKPVENPDYDAIRKSVTARFSKTLEYLAK